MKQIIAIIIIVSVIIIADIVVGNNTENIISKMNIALEDIDNMIENREEANEKIDEVVEEWEKKEKILAYYIEHDELEKIGSNIFTIQKQIQIDELEDARVTISGVQFLFEHIEQKQLLNLENFF